ncbi:MFS transporter, partial [Salmonella enterica]|nr:MFS transporter [Salmonella enterica]
IYTIVGGMLLTANVTITIWFLVFAVPGVIAALSMVLTNFHKSLVDKRSSSVSENCF